MLEPKNNDELPAIPGKRYFTIGEVSELCGVKPHVLRYWEQEFPQLKPVKRRGNRRYYQRQDVIIIRQIRSLLYEQGFTIGGARNRLTGDEAREDLSMSAQIVRQLKTELEEILRIIDEEIATLQKDGPTAYEVQRALNQIESSFFGRMERVGGFGGKADQLNGYYSTTRNPDWFEEDLARYRALSPADVQSAARAYLPAGARVELTVVPE